jgi:hypothetical protein
MQAVDLQQFGGPSGHLIRTEPRGCCATSPGSALTRAQLVAKGAGAREGGARTDDLCEPLNGSATALIHFTPWTDRTRRSHSLRILQLHCGPILSDDTLRSASPGERPERSARLSGEPAIMTHAAEHYCLEAQIGRQPSQSLGWRCKKARKSSRSKVASVSLHRRGRPRRRGAP